MGRGPRRGRHRQTHCTDTSMSPTSDFIVMVKAIRCGPHDKEIPMATLLVPWSGMTPSTDSLGGASVLPEWLGDDWALLFSQPGDFSSDGFECDRWLSILHDEFQQRGVRPLAL